MRRIVSALSFLAGLALLASAFLTRRRRGRRRASGSSGSTSTRRTSPISTRRSTTTSMAGGSRRDLRDAARLPRQAGAGERTALPRSREGLPEDLGQRQDVHLHVEERLPVLGRHSRDRGELRARHRACPRTQDAITRRDLLRRHRRGGQGHGGEGHPAARCHGERQHAHDPPDEGRAGLHLADGDDFMCPVPPDLPSTRAA